jgi:hypothetical protein
LSRVQGRAGEALVNEVVLRAQAQAEYTHENYGHFGLNLRRYAHFTSPIRRYADLIVHRADPRAPAHCVSSLCAMRAKSAKRLDTPRSGGRNFNATENTGAGTRI